MELKMPVNLLDDDAFDKLAEVEGKAWRNYQETTQHAFSFPFVKKEYLAIKKEFEEAGETIDSFLMCGYSIYGDGGISRYAITSEGEIVLCKWSTRQAKIEKAQSVGFTVV